ncbi:His/Gly/Thr/Pro-type tRNA ligase C-terminal domain-containing protein, partial [Deinococcus sp. 12RED42]|uniref:His/Gly/Thr/Pro-type tRNA ligase C-terminal domain-containing protein n=1 Tax=Deinococcus sp. 12RED42 TaxID=2745872 RepID=UPI002101FF16
NAFRDAERRGALFAGLIGSDEVAARSVQLKNLRSAEQFTVLLSDLPAFLHEQERAHLTPLENA